MSNPKYDQSRIKTKPPGIQLLECTKKSTFSYKTHQAIVLIITFLAYASYHATRKTNSIIKSSLDPQSIGSGWAPFNGANGTALLGDVDLAFLFVYSIGMFFSGHIGDRMNLRIFLTIGMVGTGLFTSLFGIGYWANIHIFYYYLIVQMFAGLFQSTGWPSVIAVLGNWFGKSKRGLIMGVWHANTSIGSISGSLIASYFLRYGWGWSMVVPSLIIIFGGFLVFMFLPVDPESVGVDKDEKNKPDLPGVAAFALCLFFSKLVAYTFLYWLPFYISHTGKLAFAV